MSDDIPDSALAVSAPPPMAFNPDIPSGALIGYKEIKPKSDKSYWEQYAEDEAAANTGAGEAVLHAATGMGSALVGGFRYAMGADRELTPEQIARNQQSIVYQPRTDQGKAAASALDTAGSYTGAAEGKWLGPRATDFASSLGLPAKVAGGIGAAAETAANVPQYLLPVIAKSVKGRMTSAPEMPEAPGAATAEPSALPEKAPQFDTAPVEGGLPDAAQTQRAQVLQRIGLEKARTSAIAGNAKDAATDFQMGRFDEPAGVEAKAQFENEKAALRTHSENIVNDTGGTIGTDEDALNTRGQTMAKPFDQLGDWFDNQRKALYGEADKRAGGGPVTNLEGVDSLLNDPKFKNTLLAKDQGGLLNSIQSQLAEFRKQSPDGFNVAGTEQFRQWLNEIWTNDNKGVIGKVKSAVDNDVLKGAGDDIYGPARQLEQMRHQTLDNPAGIARLMDRDPQTPINRTTPYVKIPDTLNRLDPDQFNNVLKTLDTMPEEIQPAAQQAKAEIKAHLANKIYEAGASTQGQWNSPAVTKIIKANSAKLQAAFADQPEVLAKIQDLESAGRILKVDQSYPGAAAQAANALKRGLMSRAVSKASSATGALAGSALGGVVAGPVGASLGAGAGAAGGEALGSSLGQGMAEQKALNRWNANTVSLSELLKRQDPK